MTVQLIVKQIEFFVFQANGLSFSFLKKYTKSTNTMRKCKALAILEELENEE